jgi:hypothetical protein
VKDDNILNSIILQRLLIDFAEIDTNYYKFRTFVAQKFPGVVAEDQV